MRRFILPAVLLVSFVTAAFSEEPQKLGKIVVTPSRLMTKVEDSARTVVVLDQAMLAYSSYDAIPDAIGSTSGIDIRRRGPEGVQADVNIRGANFEENSVLIDGVKVNDPQTGHFSMDLPVTMADIDRVEVLKGPASSIYGPDAFGGVINIITRRPEGRSVLLESDGGNFDYYRGALSVTCPLATLDNRFSFEESRSTGYMPETDFNILSLSNTTSVKTFLGVYDLLFGYLKKDFGADSFYSNLFSNEDEHTDTRFFKISGEAEEGGLKIRPRIFLRRHSDKFALDRNRPGWQTNYHTTYDYGAELNCVLENRFFDAAYGFELSRDTIDSTSLQTHSRTQDGMYIEFSPKVIDSLNINAGARADYFGEFGWQCSPSVSASLLLNGNVTLRGNIGRAYRIPTFTDLYYSDSGNRGNADLRPESSWTYETGADYRTGVVDCSMTFFHRDSYDTIDWTRMTARMPWQASNIGSVRTNGLELSIEARPKKIAKELPAERVFVSYTTLDSYRKHDYLSKYALDYLKQQIAGGAELDLFGFKNYWVLNYKKRIGDSGFLTVDMKLSKEIVRKDSVRFEAFLEAANLFDVNYSEQSDIPMPGRWIKAGARLEF